MSDKLGEENQVGGKVYVLHFQASYRTLASTEIFQTLTPWSIHLLGYPIARHAILLTERKRLYK